ncbi:MAG: hypothetical protein Aurels2KO_31160 [Aureliella sp.]
MTRFLVSNHTLEATDALHPKANQLIQSIPAGWHKQDWRLSQWYATPGFGTQHMEGVDLFLIAIDSEDGTALVYHENHF